MTPFTTLDAVAAPLPLSNIDTDKILPARFLKTISRIGLGAALFSTLRVEPGFVLNVVPWNSAGILIALENFGCGSSREHAPWALLDFGIRCIIAPSIADIFYNNCFKNGILPIVLPSDHIEALMCLASEPATARMRISLEAQTVTTLVDSKFFFDVDAGRKKDLLAGIDEIGRSLKLMPEIDSFEAERRAQAPWFPQIDATILAHG
ncbi:MULTISPECIES: 3-isopropylmalate dehydratase small subunit [unclassified Sphingomonas]|uniref:3-isopropylmalate dehydratase small subunit n=1 Tax=Novosphingobium rhizosphaerae TaxID=1551649 RepID=UPI0015C9CFC0